MGFLTVVLLKKLGVEQNDFKKMLVINCTLSGQAVGGVAEIDISKKTGAILRVVHSK